MLARHAMTLKNHFESRSASNCSHASLSAMHHGLAAAMANFCWILALTFSNASAAAAVLLLTLRACCRPRLPCLLATHHATSVRVAVPDCLVGNIDSADCMQDTWPLGSTGRQESDNTHVGRLPVQLFQHCTVRFSTTRPFVAQGRTWRDAAMDDTRLACWVYC
jgi:hypothetical protein